MNCLNKKIKTAFSLVEISIVLMVIGILITGVSKGIDLFYDFKLGQAQSMTAKSPVISTPNLTLWLETTSPNSFEVKLPLNNDKIAIWKDLNPQRIFKVNVSQSTSANKPTYVQNAINNLPALKFANDIELRSENLALNDFLSSDQATIFLVQNNFSGDTTTTSISWVPTSNNLDSGSELARLNISAQ
ncbi:MAG: prepilin-type N-terminal cleavage/methylation domain-containing protein, partial [Alphaproteobacteria bacterium]